VFVHEQNFRIQMCVAVVVGVLAWIFSVGRIEGILLVVSICAVLGLELLNSAVEKFSDLMKPRMNMHVGTVKDIMAALVLLASLGAGMVGVLVFWPHVIPLFFL